jgi:hypothetical protein
MAELGNELICSFLGEKLQQPSPAQRLLHVAVSHERVPLDQKDMRNTCPRSRLRTSAPVWKAFTAVDITSYSQLL